MIPASVPIWVLSLTFFGSGLESPISPLFPKLLLVGVLSQPSRRTLDRNWYQRVSYCNANPDHTAFGYVWKWDGKVFSSQSLLYSSVGGWEIRVLRETTTRETWLMKFQREATASIWAVHVNIFELRLFSFWSSGAKESTVIPRRPARKWNFTWAINAD